MGQFKTIGELGVDIDKMAGLLITSPSQQKITICPWDNIPQEVHAILNTNEGTIWEGILFTKEEIDKIFRPYQSDGITPTPYRLRQGTLGGKKKRKGLIRLQEVDTNNSRLIKTDGGGIEYAQIYTGTTTSHISLSVKAGGTTNKIDIK